MARLRYSGLVGSLGTGGLTSGATTHTFSAPLLYGNGATVPTLAGSDYFLVTILTSGRTLSEVVKVTAYDATTKIATIVRAQEGSTGVAHLAGDGVTQYAYPSDFDSRIRYWYRDPADITINPVPTTPTLITGMTLTVPSSPFEQTAWVQFSVNWSGASAHTDRLDIYLDGTTPAGFGTVQGVHDGSTGYTYWATVAPCPIRLQAGSPHTIGLFWNAMDSTASTLVSDRLLVVDVLPFDFSASPTSGSMPIG
jgi:hypothetical protein